MWKSWVLHSKYNERGVRGGEGRNYLLCSSHCVHSWNPPCPGRATCPCCCCSISPCCLSLSGLCRISRSWLVTGPCAGRRAGWASSLTCWSDCGLGLCSEDCGGLCTQARETCCRSSCSTCPGALETSGPGEAASSPWAGGRQEGT